MTAPSNPMLAAHVAPLAPDANALVASLLTAAAYPHPAGRPRLIETHLSWVFLAGEFAYKIRKPVVLDFVDFSSLAARRADCEEEWRLNHPLAPGLYLGVVPLTRDAGTGAIRVGGYGDTVDYAVRMRRFHQHDVLRAMALERRLGPQQIDSLADLIADFHSAAPIADASTEYGTAARIRRTLEDCADAVLALCTDLQRAKAAVSLLRQHAERLGPALQSRTRTRHIRECHGDLHLGNIVLIGTRPTPFDCLEFSAALRWIDTMYDTAFLFMDLLALDLPDLAYRLINRYLERSADYGGLAVLPFYAAMRALVRARVLLERAHQLEDADEEATTQRDEAHRLLDLSVSLLTCNDGCLILMHGLSGSGKSTRAAQYAEAEQMIRVRSDVERQRRHHANAAERYTPHAVDRTYRRMAAICRIGVRAGFPMIADATFLAHHHRDPFFALAKRLGVPVAIADCAATLNVLQARITARARRGTDASEADLAVLDGQISSQQPLSDDELRHVIPAAVSAVLPWVLRTLAHR
ncbi:AAA family ATPase [Ralstonia sp. 25C]|uniref:bifunctional aminoglycoside phosphotransferase/ATP-binding protein n=1 Tax=Ralstonia sp. 25C TaxID=3447363 RepID=UPI003F74E507